MIATPSEPLPIQEKTHDESGQSTTPAPDIDETVIFHRLQKPSCQNGCQRHAEESENLIRSKYALGSSRKSNAGPSLFIK